VTLTAGRRTAAWIALILLLAALLIGIDILVSMRLGLLANPPLFDGLFYVTDARLTATMLATRSDMVSLVSYLDDANTASAVLDTAPFLYPFSKRAPLWTLLLMLSDWLLGTGVWQPATVQFWPVGLLLLVMFLVVRRHSNAGLALAAVLVTGMLPLVSVSVRSVVYERFVSQTVDFGREWFMADLRPDVAAGMLLCCTIVAYFAWLERPTRGRAALIGGAFAAAILLKPTTSPATVATLGFAGIFTLLFWRQTLFQHVGQAILAVGVALALLAPWALAGGVELTVNRIVSNTVDQGTLWGPSGGELTAVIPRLIRFPGYLNATMGSEVWGVIGLGLILAVVFRRARACKPTAPAGYVFVGLASLMLIATLPAILRQIGACAGLLVWLAAWCVIAREARRLFDRFDLRYGIAPSVASAYGVALVGLAFLGYALWPAYGRQVGQTNQQVASALARDVACAVHEHDVVSILEIWGFPLSITSALSPTIRYVSGPHLYGRGDTPPAQVADDTLRACTECSVVVTLDADRVDDAPHLNSPVVTRPYLDALSRWVKDPASPYVLARSYPIAADPFTSLNEDDDGKYGPSLLLFLRDDGRPLPARGFDGPRDGIMFGAGWYMTEIADGERFHWAMDEAVLQLSPTGTSTLTLDIEPGPDLNGGSLDLSMIADDGTSTRLPPISARHSLTFEVPGSPTAKRSIRLRNESPTPLRNVGGRVLNFRVFDAAWGQPGTAYGPTLLLQVNASTDIGPPEARRQLAAARTTPADGLFVGQGWHDVEQVVGVFRWADNDAEIVVTRPSGERRELSLELEPGPGVAGDLALDLVDEGDGVVATIHSTRRETIRVPLPIRREAETQVFRLRVRGGGLPTPNDPRILNFRVFSLRWAS
jgi:hypothetical protein